MDQAQKDAFLVRAKTHLANTVRDITSAHNRVTKQNQHIRTELPKVNEDDKLVQQKLLEHGVERERELEQLIEAPYFFHCHVDFARNQKEDIYIGKYSFTEKNIYSWITPVATMRFEKPGNISYTTTAGDKKKGTLTQKDQYMIADREIVFLATESIDIGRELIYQAYFSNQKKDFVLPEIVAQMEKAQDTVIRANHRGPLVIAGPAGSGKTTLALHRVAYLCQAPDVSQFFQPTAVIVFVQDEGTRSYFAGLLPQLGIKGVTITTFPTWAMNVLGLEQYQYKSRIGDTETERDLYEFQKKEILTNAKEIHIEKDVFNTLEQIYQQTFTKRQLTIFETQRKQKQLDRFDLTILLSLYKKQHGKLTLLQEYYQMSKTGAAKKKRGRFPVNYSLMIFDEFQNYLGEQIRLAKTTLDPNLNAVMYIGDMAQQTHIGTIQSWREAKENIPEKRKIVLQKVYRNTKQILQYIQSLGYDIEIADSLREGTPVIEKICTSTQEEIQHVKHILTQTNATVGILAKTQEQLEPFKKALHDYKHAHIMTMHEAQGVEFDTVCIVNVTNKMFETNYPEENKASQKLIAKREEKNSINKDLLYVALTRAMNTLHVSGTHTLSQLFT